MTEETEQQRQESEVITLSIDWHVPEGIQSRYANNVLVQAGQYEFTISFFEVQVPLLSGSPEENKAKLQQMRSVRADCVSKIVIPPNLVQGLMDALQTELDKFSSQQLK